MRTTPQRIMIIELLAGNTSHPPAEEIFETLKKTYPFISIATVYNTLNILARMGEITPFTAGGTRRFDSGTNPHDHALCTRCGKLYDVARKKRTGTELMIGKHQFKVSKQQTIYYGVCQECLKKDN
jgi:Fur family peroxide stress response transcriptional regulator